MENKEFIVKEDGGFRLRVSMKKCSSPKNLNHIEFFQECKNKNGDIDFSSKYEFFITDPELVTLAKGLLNE